MVECGKIVIIHIANKAFHLETSQTQRLIKREKKNEWAVDGNSHLTKEELTLQLTHD